MENLSHSRHPSRSVPSLPKKTCNGSSGYGFSSGKAATSAYDEVFGPPRFGGQTLSPRLEDYCEIFGGFNGTSRAAVSSIPVLDLPLVDDRDIFFDVRGSSFDYREVFGGFEDLDLAPTYEELLMDRSESGDGESSDEAWTPVETGSISGETEHYGESPCFSIGKDSYESFDGNTELNISYNKAGQLNYANMSNGITHVADLGSVPGYSFSIDEMECPGGATRLKDKTQSFMVHGDTSGCAIGEIDRTQQRYNRSVSSPSEGFVTVSDINLMTQPSEVPPPSRPPPLLQRDSTASEGSMDEDSPSCFDAEADASSAAVKEAMKKAEARLRSAKELLEKKRDGARTLTKTSSATEQTTKEGYIKLTAGLEVEKDNDMDTESSEDKHGSDKWKEATQFFELVRAEKPRNSDEKCRGKGVSLHHNADFAEQKHKLAAKGDMNKDQKRGEKPGHDVLRFEEDNKVSDHGGLEKNEIMFEWEQNARKLREALGQEDKVNVLEVSLKPKEDDQIDEEEKKLEEALKRIETEIRMKEAREKEENEMRMREVLEKAENEKRMKAALAKEEKERLLKEALEKEEKDRRMMEVFEKAELERINKEEEEEEEEEEEKNRVIKEACEKAELEKKLKEDKERQLKEAQEREENERKLKEEMEKTEREAKEREEQERIERENRRGEEDEKERDDCVTEGRETMGVRLEEVSRKEWSEERSEDAGGDNHETLNKDDEPVEKETVDMSNEACPWKYVEQKLKDACQSKDAGDIDESNSVEKQSQRDETEEEKIKETSDKGFTQREKEVERMKREQKERLRIIEEEEREREREREKDRMAFDQRTLADARERLERVCVEAREKSLVDKLAAEARLRSERAAVERATAEARERAAEKAAAEARERMERSASFASSRSQSSSAYNRADGESPQRYTSRLERHRRTADRVAKALAEKNMRDLIAQREQAERTRLAETLDAEVKRWSSGKEGNIRALLSTLQYILSPESNWHPIHLTEVITSAAVKKAYRKATLCVHPDKLQQRGASIHQKYICEKVFDLLKEAWNRFNSEER